MDENFRRKFRQETAEHIKQHGRSILGAFGDDDGPSFAYSIGNSLKGFPELLVIGTKEGAFLNVLSEMMIEAGKPFEDGQLVRIENVRTPFKLVRAGQVAKEEFTIQVGQYLGHENYQVLQVLIPDRDGKYPGDAGCKPPYSKMPVLRGGGEGQ